MDYPKSVREDRQNRCEKRVKTASLFWYQTGEAVRGGVPLVGPKGPLWEMWERCGRDVGEMFVSDCSPRTPARIYRVRAPGSMAVGSKVRTASDRVTGQHDGRN